MQTLLLENKALQEKSDKMQSEFLSKLHQSKNVKLKLMHPKEFLPRAKSFSQIKSNLLKQKTNHYNPEARENMDDCTFKPVTNKVEVSNYIPLIERVFPKKEILLEQDMGQKQLDDLVKSQNRAVRMCLPSTEWDQKDQIVFSETNSPKQQQDDPNQKTKRNFNPNFYEEQFVWLKGVHQKIRQEQLAVDEASESIQTPDDQMAKTRDMNDKLLKTNKDFLTRLEEGRRTKKEHVEEIAQSAYNFSFQPVTNNNYDTVRSKVMLESAKPVFDKNRLYKKEELPQEKVEKFIRF